MTIKFIIKSRNLFFIYPVSSKTSGHRSCTHKILGIRLNLEKKIAGIACNRGEVAKVKTTLDFKLLVFLNKKLVLKYKKYNLIKY